MTTISPVLDDGIDQLGTPPCEMIIIASARYCRKPSSCRILTVCGYCANRWVLFLCAPCKEATASGRAECSICSRRRGITEFW